MTRSRATGQEAGGEHRPTQEPRLSQRGFTEVVDAHQGVIRARGHLDRRAADMLTGTVEALLRDGHRHVVVDLTDVDAADAAGLDDLATLRDRLGAAGSTLTVLDAPGPTAG